MAGHGMKAPDSDQPVGEWPGLPPNFWRSAVTPRTAECAWTYHSRGTGYAADNMWSHA